MMRSTKAKAIENANLNTGRNNSFSRSTFAMEKNSKNNTKRYVASSALSPKVSAESTTKLKHRRNIVDRFQPLPLLPFKTEVLDTVRKKTSVKLSARSKNRKSSTKNNTKTKPDKQTDNETLFSQSSIIMELPKLRTIIDNMTSYVEIDHEKIYPLLGIFIDYVQESLSDGVSQKKLNAEEFEGLSEELKEIIERIERQKIMDPLISPDIEMDNANKKEYEDELMENKLNNLLPILRKCNGNVNFTDKYGQTILHIFIKRYVVLHQILSEEDLLKPEYENSPQQKLRRATFRVIEELLKKGASVSIGDQKGNTPLHTLAKYDGYEEIMRVLLEHYREIDKSDKNGDTVLHLMVGTQKLNEKHLQNINVLVSKGADIHKRNNHGKAPIHLAFEFCHFEVLDIFQKKLVDFNLKTKDGKTSLHLVCLSMKDEIVKMKAIDVLVNKGINVNDVDNQGYSAVHCAVKSNSRLIIQRLINLNANMFCRTKEMNLTPLHLASQFGCSSAINTVIQAGVNVNNVTTGDIIPLHLAILYSDPLTVECLIVSGADVHRRDAIFDFTPTHMTAFACGRMLDLLVKKGGDVNAKNRMGITPLHLASMLGNVEVVEALCEYGADVNCRDDLFGMTALHWASMRGKRLNLCRMSNGEENSEDEATVSRFWKPLFLKTCRNCDNHDNIKSNGSSKTRIVFKSVPSVCTIILQTKSEVIKVLLIFGAHADLQDNDGRVAVYNVLKNDNVEGMKHFLEYGLDFNHFDTSRMILNTWNSVKVRSYVLWNAMKLRVAKLPVAEAYVSKVVKPQFQCYYGYWEDEVKKMKTYMIEDKVSLHDFLCMKVKFRVAYVQRVLALQRDLEVKFSGYCSLILASCRQAVARMDLEKLAINKLSQMGYDYVLKACYKRVFSYLNNVDLRALVESFENNKNENIGEVIEIDENENVDEIFEINENEYIDELSFL